MSSFVQDWKCSKCKSNNACYEDFKDSEEGYIFECKDCKLNYCINHRLSFNNNWE